MSNAFTSYIKINSEQAATAEALFVSILSKVEVPKSFAIQQTTTNNSTKRNESSHLIKNTAGLVAIIDNPTMSGKQALAICEPQSQFAGSNAGAIGNSNYQTNCSSCGYSINCNTTNAPQSFAEGFAKGLASEISKRKAKKRALASCLAHYGWKKLVQRPHNVSFRIRILASLLMETATALATD